MLRRHLLFAVPLLALACADEPPPDDPGVLEAQTTENELMYLRDANEVASAFSTGAATLTPTRSFRIVDLVLTFPAGTDAAQNERYTQALQGEMR